MTVIVDLDRRVDAHRHRDLGHLTGGPVDEQARGHPRPDAALEPATEQDGLAELLDCLLGMVGGIPVRGPGEDLGSLKVPFHQSQVGGGMIPVRKTGDVSQCREQTQRDDITHTRQRHQQLDAGFIHRHSHQLLIEHLDFLFELIEGNTVTRVQFRLTLRRSRLALQSGELTTEHREEARTLLGQVTHFLDVPLFLVIVYCGAMRPGTWSHVLLAIVVALVAAFLLTAMVPRLALREPGSQHYQ